MNKPHVTLIWAEDEQHLIGNGTELPWHISADMAWFRQQTMAKPILMGRKTHESIGRALPGRMNIIQSRSARNWGKNCVAVTTITQALQAAAEHPELMVMGGAEIYQRWLPLADRLLVTHVEGCHKGDVYFPPMVWDAWQCIAEVRPDDGEPCRFCTYERC
ncbi:MAG: dihydrofolate reductase [Mariprofundaceae bacterium]|nr:dihydrofolate reductase [Mariprofundaceae bacterium]